MHMQNNNLIRVEKLKFASHYLGLNRHVIFFKAPLS